MLRHSILPSLVLSTLPALAQWTTQTIPLRPGWNAVFLEVQPEPRECEALFSGLPIESAWGWNKRFFPEVCSWRRNRVSPEHP